MKSVFSLCFGGRLGCTGGWVGYSMLNLGPKIRRSYKKRRVCHLAQTEHKLSFCLFHVLFYFLSFLEMEFMKLFPSVCRPKQTILKKFVKSFLKFKSSLEPILQQAQSTIFTETEKCTIRLISALLLSNEDFKPIMLFVLQSPFG